MPYKTEEKVGMQWVPSCQNVLHHHNGYIFGSVLQNNEEANIHTGKSGLIKTACSSCSHLEMTIFVFLTPEPEYFMQVPHLPEYN